jgi:hypothetical protein
MMRSIAIMVLLILQLCKNGKNLENVGHSQAISQGVVIERLGKAITTDYSC